MTSYKSEVDGLGEDGKNRNERWIGAVVSDAKNDTWALHKLQRESEEAERRAATMAKRTAARRLRGY